MVIPNRNSADLNFPYYVFLIDNTSFNQDSNLLELCAENWEYILIS